MEKLRKFLSWLKPHVDCGFPLPQSRGSIQDFRPAYANKYARQRETQAAFFRNRRFWQIPLKESSPNLDRKDIVVLAARMAGPGLNSKNLGLMLYHSPSNPRMVLVGVSSEEESVLSSAHEIMHRWAESGFT